MLNHCNFFFYNSLIIAILNSPANASLSFPEQFLEK